MPEHNENTAEFKSLYPDALKPDAARAAAFLCDFTDGGPVTVVAIPAEGAGARGRTFDTSDAKAHADLRSFIAAYESKPFNIYWMPNEAAHDCGHDVPANEDIVAIRGVVLDFDPVKGELLDDERMRLRGIVYNLVEILQPWAVVDTGGGMQMVFRLEKPVAMPLDEFGAAADAHEAFLKSLARALGADTKTCKLKNLFRVPFTWNHPTAAKKAAGRDRTAAGVWYRSQATTTLQSLRSWCVVRPDDAPGSKPDLDFNGLTEADLLDVLGTPERLPVHLSNLVQSSPVVDRAVRAVGARPGDMSADDFQLCMSLIRFGLTAPADVALMLCAYGAKAQRERHRLWSYVRGTVANAVHKVASESIDGFSSPHEAEAAKKQHTERIRFKGLAELTSGLYDAAQVGVVQGLLGERQTTIVYGASGSGKTFVALDIAYAVAQGRPWNSRQVSAGVVAYVAAESPRSVAYRLDGLRQAYGDAPSFMTMTEVVDMFDPRVDLQALVGALDSLLAPPRLLVFDTLARVNSGDENSTRDMSALIKNGDRLRDRYNANVMWVHHSGKDESRGARGSSALRAATDTEIEITPGSFRLTKLRDGDINDGNYNFSLSPRKIGTLPDGTDVSTCIIQWRGTVVSANDPGAKLRESIHRTIEELRQPSTIKEILDTGKAIGLLKLNTSASVTRRAITRAIEDGIYFRAYEEEKGFERRYGLLQWMD